MPDPAEGRSLPDRSATALREQVAAALAYNDQCGPGPVSRSEYLADADTLIAMCQQEAERERDRLRAENEALKAQVASHRATAMERDDFLYRIAKISREYEDRLDELSGAVDEGEASRG